MRGGPGPEEVDGAILAALARIDELRGAGMWPEQIAVAMATDGAPVPGGGAWSPAKVERILEVFDSVRERVDASDQASTTPEGLADEAPSDAEAALPVEGPEVEEDASAVPAEPVAPRSPDPSPPQPPRIARRAPNARLTDPTAAVGSTSPTRPSPSPEPVAGPEPHARTDREPRPLVAAARTATPPEVIDPGQPVLDAAIGHDGEHGLGPVAAARWMATGLVLAGLGAGGFLLIRTLVDGGGPTSSDRVGDAATPTTVVDETTTVTTEQPDPADTMAIRIETDDPARTPADGELVAASATVRKDGKLYLEGAFASQDDADAFIERAGAVFGRDNIVESYVVDPSAPEPTVGDVALDKPVLFESGTAEIHPDYIPFLEACAGVLELNPHIVMSISAYTDSVGPDDFNLELSRQRAQAIVDFYRERDIGIDQLIGSGFGEANPVSDNTTEDGRSANRRAMLQLLNVMGDEADALNG